MSIDVSVILQGLDSGSIPVVSGLSAFLLKSRDSPVDVLTALPYVLSQLESSTDSTTISTALELLTELLGPNEEECVGVQAADELIQSVSFSRLFQLLSITEFSAPGSILAQIRLSLQWVIIIITPESI